MCKIRSSANRNNFASSFSIGMHFISFSCIFALARTSSLMLNGSDENEHFCLLSHPKEKHFQTFFKFNFYCMFFHYHLVPAIPPSPSNHHTVVHVQESFFVFAQSLYPLTQSHTLAVILLSIYESVPIFLVSSVSSLDSTCD